MPTHRHHNKHYGQLTSGSCRSRDAVTRGSHAVTRGSRITFLGGRLSEAPPHRGSRISEFYSGSCQTLVQQHHNKILNATDFRPGDITWRDSEDEEDEATCNDLVRHHAQRGLRSPKEYFDSEDEEVQMILSQAGGDKDEDCPFVDLAANRTQGSESIERVSDIEDTEDDVFMGYFTVDSDGKKRPIPAPRRLIPMPLANQVDAALVGESTAVIVQAKDPRISDWGLYDDREPPVVKALGPNMTLRSLKGVKPYRRRGTQAKSAMEDVARDSRSETSKSGKEVELVEVRGIRSSLSTDSQGRDLPLIPPGYDGFSSQNRLNALNEFSEQIKVDKVNKLPQQSRAEEAWNQAGPEFQLKHVSTLMVTLLMQELSCRITSVLDFLVHSCTPQQT